MLEVPEAMRCVLLYTLEAVEGGLCSLEVLELMRCVLLRLPEAVEGGLFASGARGDALRGGGSGGGGGDACVCYSAWWRWRR